MFCKHCGSEIPNGSRFCGVCGAQLMEIPANNQTPPQTQVPPYQAQTPPTYQAQQFRQVPPTYQAPPQYGAPQYNTVPQNNTNPPTKPLTPEEDKVAARTLTWGILGLAFSVTSFSFLITIILAYSFGIVFSILGIVFSGIGKGAAAKYIRMRGKLEGRAKVGNGLSIAGLAVGISITAIFLLALITLL